MRECTVCGAQNDDLAVVCPACRSYLQAKVDTLDLFSTLWGVVESPGATLRRIALSRHKNYVIALGCLAGVAMVYGGLWYRNMGPGFANIATLLGTGLLVGPPLGIAFLAAASAATLLIGRILGGHGSFRNVVAVLAYALVPTVFSLFFVFPAEIALFGIYFFGNNPPPMVINRLAYLFLVGLDGGAVLWSCLLLAAGCRVSLGLARMRAYVVSFLLVALAGAGVVALRVV